MPPSLSQRAALSGAEASPDGASDDTVQLEKWKVEEVMYREALRLGLDENDATIRKHLIEETRQLLVEAGTSPEPSKAELDAWLARHRTSYLTPERYDYQHLVSGDAPGIADEEAQRRALELSQRMSEGSPAEAELVEGQTFKQIARRFTPKFATELIRRQDWQALKAPDGWHVVRLVRRTGGVLPPRRELEPRLISDFRRANRGQASERALERLSREYLFVDAPSPAG
jgi:hypothetical protein